MGGEVSTYCLGVLSENDDLVQVNTTNIDLISKISNPINMINFKPSSLCNVIYKMISKMVANRIQRVLDRCNDRA